ncbi:glycosyltransferase family 2 protein [Kiritimatiellota bacterium B12222]|nr:glycosyltransferase family 2 protein [Kiritimatiellota bacterium B12222]
MKISIAMATYNGEKFVYEQLESFINQTRQPDEVIITDDGSNDQTVSLINSFSEIAPFDVKVFCNKKRLGYSQNFNLALSQTTGDIVFLSDQDDVWFPKKISKIVKLFEKEPDTLLIMNDAALTDKELKETGYTKIGQIQRSGASMDKFVMGCCCAFRRELLTLCLPVPTEFNSHDKWLVGIATSLNKKYIYHRVLQYYRRHDENTSKHYFNKATKMSCVHAFLYKASLWINGEMVHKLEERHQQQIAFLEGINRVLEEAPITYHPHLQRLHKLTTHRIHRLSKILAIFNRK